MIDVVELKRGIWLGVDGREVTAGEARTFEFFGPAAQEMVRARNRGYSNAHVRVYRSEDEN